MTRCRLAPGLLVGLMGLVAALAIGQTAGGDVMKTLYVSPAGDDANPGTQERPLATIGGARDAVRGVNRNMTGDIVVILAGGMYSIAEPIVFDHRDSGTGGHKIVYRAADGQEPVLSGGRAITGWRPDADGRWKASTTLSNFRQLYVDGKRAVRARGECAAGRGTPRQRRLPIDRSRDGRLEKPAGHRVLLLRGLVPHAVQGPEHPARRRPRDRHHAPAPLHECPREGGRAGESAQLHRERLGVARRTRRVVSGPGRKDGVLQAASGPGHDQGPRRRSGRRETGRVAGDSGSTRRERPLRRHHLCRGRLAPAQRDRPGRRAGQLPVELEGSHAASSMESRPSTTSSSRAQPMWSAARPRGSASSGVRSRGWVGRASTSSSVRRATRFPAAAFTTSRARPSKWAMC